MKITLNSVKAKVPCKEAYQWSVNRLKGKEDVDVVPFIQAAMAEDKLEWSNWFIARVFNYQQQLKYAVFAAEQVLDVYEKEFPGDTRPRNAIESAKECINNSSEENTKKALDAGNKALFASSLLEEGFASCAASSAAFAAQTVFCDTSLGLSAYAVDRAVKASVDIDEMYIKILNYGIELIK